MNIITNNWKNNIHGIEFDFLAADMYDSIAIISTAGFGPIPNFIMEHIKIYRNNSIYTYIESLNKITEAEIEIRTEHIVNEWVMAAERGIYVFDWSDRLEAYVRQMRPCSKLIKVEEISLEMSEIAVRLSTCDFSAISVIN
jgi:hypothetical protein